MTKHSFYIFTMLWALLLPTTASGQITNLTASDIMPTTANLSWTGGQAPFEVRYRKVDSNDEWQTITAEGNTCQITGLEPETEYDYQVRGDGDEEWTTGVNFITPSADAAPTDLTATELSNSSVQLSWTGYQGNFEVQYRKVVPVLFSDGFSYEDGGFGSWSTVDEDGDGNNWYIGLRGDNFLAASNSWYRGQLNPDNWLISPKIQLDGTMSVWIRRTSDFYDQFAIYAIVGDWKEVYEFNGTMNGIFDLLVEETLAPNDFTEYTADLSGYGGKMGHIAIRHFDSDDGYALQVDSIQVAPSENEWNEATVDGTTSILTGLEPHYKYEWRVRSVLDESTTTDWTTATFTKQDCVNVNVSSAGYATLYYSEKSLIVPEGVEAATYKVVDGKLTQSKTYAAGTVIPASEPVVLKADEGTYLFLETDVAAERDADNMLNGTDVNANTSGGTYYYALQAKAADGTGGPGFYWMNENGAAFTNGAHKAWLALDEMFAEAAGAKNCYLFDESEGGTTGIHSVDADNVHSGQTYNISGQRVDKHYKGIVIVNGNKLIKK